MVLLMPIQSCSFNTLFGKLLYIIIHIVVFDRFCFQIIKSLKFYYNVQAVCSEF